VNDPLVDRLMEETDQSIENLRRVARPVIRGEREVVLEIIEAIGGDRRFWSETQHGPVGKASDILRVYLFERIKEAMKKQGGIDAHEHGCNR
jgi:hypothetical protein